MKRRGFKLDIKNADKNLLLMCIVFVLSLPLLTPRIYSSDEIEYYVYLRSLIKDADLDFKNEYEAFASRAPEEYRKSGFHHTFIELTTATGLKNNFAPIGCSVLWLPWFVAADLYVRGANFLGADIPTDGYSAPYIQLIAYGSLLYGFIGLIFIFLTLRRIFDKLLPLITTLTVWFATPVVYYMYVQAPMSHSCSLFAVSLFVWYWYRTLGSLKISRWAALGALLGLAGLVREQDLFFVVLLLAEGVGHIYMALKEKTLPLLMKLPGAFISAGFCSLLVFIPQLISYKILYGRFSPSPLVSRKMDWSSPHSWEVLFNYSHGLFFWTPVLIAAVTGLILFSIRYRFLGLSLLAAFMTQVYISGAVGSWHASGSFGHRRFVSCSMIFAVGMAYIFSLLWAKRLRIAAFLGSIFFIVWNLQLIIQFATGMMDRTRFDAVKIARTAVTELPGKVFDIGKKFFTSREELYKIPSEKGNSHK